MDAEQNFQFKVVPPKRGTQPLYRKRRGKWVAIPEEWQGKVPYAPTIRKRASKWAKRGTNVKNQNVQRQIGSGKHHFRFTGRKAAEGMYKGEATAPRIEEWDDC